MECTHSKILGDKSPYLGEAIVSVLVELIHSCAKILTILFGVKEFEALGVAGVVLV